MGELNSENCSLRTNDVGNVGDGSTGGSTEIEDLGTGAHVDVVNTTKDTGSQLGTEGVPNTVFNGRGSSLAVLRLLATNTDALLAIDALARSQVLGDKEILLSAGNKDTSVTMRLDNDLTIRS